MLVYTLHITPRLKYILQYFNEKLLVDATVTDDLDFYISSEDVKLNYSDERIDKAEFFIQQTGLLQQHTISKQFIECFEWKETKAFFKTEDDLGFDIFSAVFYLLSRYEEYREHEPDEHGRYAHWNSLAWKEGFLNKPMIDCWIYELKKLLIVKFPTFNFQFSIFNFLPTYDIDIAWSFKHKGFLRSIAASIKKPSTIIQRIKVVQGNMKDPFDCYDWLQQLHATNELNPFYFFPVTEEKSALDKNISAKSIALKQLIKRVKEKAEIGLHPSVYSHTAKENLIKEKNTLQQIIQHPVTKSRYHYLLFHLPHSYRELIAAGITDDYSMGYGTVNGFRASTSNSFLWYDLEKEETTTLRIHPFAFMEANNFYELHHSTDEAYLELKQLFNEVKKVNGTFITVFHNQFLGSDKMFTGWREMYEEFISELNFAKDLST
jgi:hypothetical protein